MRDLTIAIVLRIMLIVAFCLLMFSVLHNTGANHNSSHLYFQAFVLLSLLLIYFHQRKHIKKNGGRIAFYGHLIPEFNPKDEREQQISGDAYKIAFSTMLVISVVVISSVAFFQIFDGILQPLFIFLSIGFIPISGLLAYFFSYRHHYKK
ncbi:hypothetical protein QTL97_14865 [Sporosarcina thermotolerans]|uniref:Uncharacterized protein n=1 Tax=Sporosarcina thermotolerans TaxID=633404 RepID=A0AAW9A9T0_9BACL|nr:hypothetical protein [Sporosarcina thermotolerans]MDW0118212.1 hypothetical protein [Sporosarcina thermotolerans]WHT47691.1 hypothetical protein QNH10_16410 [Sporosarcina thermotolerans]